MRAALRVSGMKEARIVFQNLEGRTTKALQEEMLKIAKDTQRIARAMSPFLTHDLEKSIQIREPDKASKRRWYAEVFMGGPVSSGMDVGEYAMRIHESWELLATRPETLERAKRKEARNGGYRVGSKFMERAADEVEKTVPDRIYNVFRLIGDWEEA